MATPAAGRQALLALALAPAPSLAEAMRTIREKAIVTLDGTLPPISAVGGRRLLPRTAGSGGAGVF